MDLHAELQQKAQEGLNQAKRQGVDSAEIYVSQDMGFSVSARAGDVETLEHHKNKGLSITVYDNKRCGSASTSDLSHDAIKSTVTKAVTIAHYASEDPYSGLADAERMAFHYPELDLFHHWDITPAQAIEKAIECETIAREQDKRITDSEGASITTIDGFRVYANTHEFMGCYPSTCHTISCSVVAQDQDDKQSDYEYSLSRKAQELDDVGFVARHAAAKTLHRLGARKLSTRQCPVIFQSSVAKGLLGAFIGAISGGNLYRRTSFLLDHIDKPVFPEHVHIYQRPHLLCSMGSSPFDAEGVVTEDRDYVKEGILKSYVLGSYSARKLDLHSTGNAGGVYNLAINYSDMNLVDLMKQMGTGLLVTDLMGQGINLITGNYSRGAFGYWIENGEIQHPVHEITIAGNLKEMFMGFVAVANDIDRRGNIQTGSILIDKVTIAGY